MRNRAAGPGLRYAARRQPRLDIRAPLFLGLGVILLFFGAGVCGAAWAPIDKGVGLPGTIIVESKTQAIQHQRGGIVGRILVTEGQEVAAGELLVSLDTKDMDEQIGALKVQAEQAAKQLSLIRQEAATMAELLERKLTQKSRVMGLQRQVAEVEKEVASLHARIAITGQEITRAEVRSPVAGRVLSIAVHGTGAVVAPGGTVLEIVPQSDRLVIEGHLAPNQIENVKPGMPAKVWLTALSWRDQRPLKATLAWVSPDSIEDKRTGAPYFLARVELEESRADIGKRMTMLPGMRAEILLLTGERTLLDQILDPLMRNMKHAFHG